MLPGSFFNQYLTSPSSRHWRASLCAFLIIPSTKRESHCYQFRGLTPQPPTHEADALTTRPQRRYFPLLAYIEILEKSLNLFAGFLLNFTWMFLSWTFHQIPLEEFHTPLRRCVLGEGVVYTGVGLSVGLSSNFLSVRDRGDSWTNFIQTSLTDFVLALMCIFYIGGSLLYIEFHQDSFGRYFIPPRCVLGGGG